MGARARLSASFRVFALDAAGFLEIVDPAAEVVIEAASKRVPFRRGLRFRFARDRKHLANDVEALAGNMILMANGAYADGTAALDELRIVGWIVHVTTDVMRAAPGRRHVSTVGA
jgi:hypothetical protein